MHVTLSNIHPISTGAGRFHGSTGASKHAGADPATCLRHGVGHRCCVRAVRQPVSPGGRPPADAGAGLGIGQCRLVLPAGDDVVPGVRRRRRAVAVWRHQARRRPRRTGVQLSVLGRHVVRGRHQHHPVLLLRVRTADPLPAAAAGCQRCRRGRRTTGHAVAVPALGTAWLGRVRAGGDGHGLLRIPPQPAPGAAFGAVSVDRQPHQRAHRLHRGCAGHRRHGVRAGRGHGLRRAASQCRAGAPVRCRMRTGCR